MSTKRIQILGGFPQADWAQTDETKSDYIKNKPDSGEVITASVQDDVLILEQNPGIVAKGDDGYTPIKGVDYWTDEDKAEILNKTKSLEVELTNRVDVESTDPAVTLKDAVSSHSASEILTRINNGETVVVKNDQQILPFHYSVLDMAIFETVLYDMYTDAVMTHKNAYFYQVAIKEDKTARLQIVKLTSDCVEGSVTEDRVTEMIDEALANIPHAEDLTL